MANKKSLALTKEQYENLIGSMRKGGNTFRANDRIATALVLEANLGLRIGDILKLRLQDIVLDGGRYRLDITEEKTMEKTKSNLMTEEKTQKKRIFTVPQPIYQYLRVYCIDHDIKTDQTIFPITERTIQKYLAKVTSELGYPNIGTHSFRKFFATEIYVNNNYNIILVQQLLQHSSAAITQRYIGISSKELEDALAGHIELL